MLGRFELDCFVCGLLGWMLGSPEAIAALQREWEIGPDKSGICEVAGVAYVEIRQPLDINRRIDRSMICAEALWSDWLLLISHKPHLVEQPDREIRLLIL
jgi:hypothetical protein